jgi:6,7-dimethyl-8-ribityllumazine synthase
MVSIGMVVAKFNGPITELMKEEAEKVAKNNGVTVIDTVYVPGVYDSPFAADRLARRKEIDAVVVIGAIISGETDHEHVIAHAAAQGLTKVSLDRDKPITLGIIGPGMNPKQAVERIENGGFAMESAIRMVNEIS